MRCDYPGCTAAVAGHGVSEVLAHMATGANARLAGWKVALDRGVPELARDLCPLHKESQ